MQVDFNISCQFGAKFILHYVSVKFIFYNHQILNINRTTQFSQIQIADKELIKAVLCI